MTTETGQRQQKVEQSSRGDVLVRNVDSEIYFQFCERAKSLGVPPEAVLEEILDRGIREWLRMRSK